MSAVDGDNLAAPTQGAKVAQDLRVLRHPLVLPKRRVAMPFRVEHEVFKSAHRVVDDEERFGGDRVVEGHRLVLSPRHHRECVRT